MSLLLQHAARGIRRAEEPKNWAQLGPPDESAGAGLPNGLSFNSLNLI